MIPRFDSAILLLEWKEAVRDKFVMGAPRPLTPSERSTAIASFACDIEPGTGDQREVNLSFSDWSNFVRNPQLGLAGAGRGNSPMKKSRFSEQQIAFILKQAEDGTTVEEEVCRKVSWPPF